ncbi:hypothetical protein HLB23_30680 [Nocardia uniformis]|uniref:Uncharacterized protein n=1 Tax=Nocardia uniformis TaxID=53432 RepID=A0A849C8L8_9NOCA|nr:hypothetical protein [Nocardia uniformis]NNH74166.1 hypothetical protein [Nocardia uniformis]
MTGTNPPPGGSQDPGNHQETAQWWATPPAGTDSQPVQGDPTMLNYGGGQPVPADPTMLNYGGGQPVPADPTMLNYGGGAVGYTPPQQQSPPQQPNYGGQPGYASGPAPVQPPYASGPAPVQPMYGGGYPQPPRPPSGNKTGVIVGGIIGLVVCVGIAIGAVAIFSSDDPIKIGEIDQPVAAEGKYTMDGVNNACTLITPSAVSKWARNAKGSPKNSETQGNDYSGGKLKCDADYTEPGPGKYSLDTNADIALEVSFLGPSTKYRTPDPDYKSWKERATETTGSGIAFGDVTGIGEEGYWYSKTDGYSSIENLTYTVGARDSNVSVKVTITLRRDEQSPASKEEVGQVAKEQVQKALDSLPKK